MKHVNPDSPLTDEEWKRLGTPIHGINELPLEAREAVKNTMRGRPPLDNPKKKVTIRLDADLLTALRATGNGWQTRVNSALKRLVAEHSL